MCFTFHEFFNNVTIGVATGLVTGLYSSFVVTRYHIFLDLKNEVLRTIQKIDYRLIDSKLVITNNMGLGNLLYISSDFCRLGHNAANEATGNLFKEISRVNIQAEMGQISSGEYANHFLEWQKSARNIAPSWRKIFFFF